MRRHRHINGGGKTINSVSVHRKPVTGIQQVAGIVIDRGQLQSRNRRIVRRIEHTLILKCQSGGLVFCQRALQRNAHTRILRHAVGSQRLSGRIRHFRQTKIVMQLERGDVQIVKRRDLDPRSGGNLMLVWVQDRINLIIVCIEASPFRSPSGK